MPPDAGTGDPVPPVAGAPRRRSVSARGNEALYFEIGYRPPLDWDALLGFLAGRAIDGVEAVDYPTYLRSLCIAGPRERCRGWLAVTPHARRPALKVALSPALEPVAAQVLSRIERVFDLACNPDEVAAALGPLARARPGLRLPGAFDGFEVAVRAVLGQQITVKAARTLAGRFVAAFGEPVETPFAGVARVFPAATRIAGLQMSQIAEQGVIATRARSIISLAQALGSGQLVLDPQATVDDTVSRLRKVPGVGDWTAQYIAMRALSWQDAFPASDYGVLKAMGETDPRRALHRAQGWRPWRAYAVIHLWKSLEGS
jgi:AraC family transcriptional regulator of adaptative response / DNA-3-methyladenine glycosylase II